MSQAKWRVVTGAVAIVTFLGGQALYMELLQPDPLAARGWGIGCACVAVLILALFYPSNSDK